MSGREPQRSRSRMFRPMNSDGQQKTRSDRGEKEGTRDRAGSEQSGKGTREGSSSITDRYFNCNT